MWFVVSKIALILSFDTLSSMFIQHTLVRAGFADIFYLTHKIIFLKHNKMVRGERHMIDQFLGFNQEKSGGVYVLENPFSDHSSVSSVSASMNVNKGRLKNFNLEGNGSFISLDLSYDGKSILFAYTEAEHEVPENADWSRQSVWRPREQALQDAKGWTL